jgi:methionine sulfoxide reductase heme-binding subunit
MFWWYLTRATGIVATVLISCSLLGGLLFSARETGARPKPNWWLDLHNMLGGLALGFTVAHVLAVIIDPDADFTIAQALVPGQSNDLPLAIGYGIVSLYLLIAVVATSWPKLRFRRRVWRAIHLTSLPAGVLAVMHAWQTGSDRSAPAFQFALAASCGAVVAPLVLRLLSVRRKRLDRSRPPLTEA